MLINLYIKKYLFDYLEDKWDKTAGYQLLCMFPGMAIATHYLHVHSH